MDVSDEESDSSSEVGSENELDSNGERLVILCYYQDQFQVGHFFKAGLVFVHCLKDYMVLKILFHTANQIQTALIAISSCAK